ALRRAGLGAIRILFENLLRIRLRPPVLFALAGLRTCALRSREGSHDVPAGPLAFFADRLKGPLRHQRRRHALRDAVFWLEGQDDLLLIVRRVEALGKLLETDDGKNLLAGYKRATNIIRIEEKKDARQYVGRPDPSLYRQEEEWALAKAIDAAKDEAANARRAEKFEAAMRAVGEVRPHLGAFFDKVNGNVAVSAGKDKTRDNRPRQPHTDS